MNLTRTCGQRRLGHPCTPAPAHRRQLGDACATRQGRRADAYGFQTTHGRTVIGCVHPEHAGSPLQRVGVYRAVGTPALRMKETPSYPWLHRIAVMLPFALTALAY